VAFQRVSEIHDIAAATREEEAMDAHIQAMNVRIEAVAARIDAVETRQRLAIAQRRNFQLISAGGTFQLHQLLKVNVSVGPPLPGQAATANMAPAPVGSTYPVELAPSNAEELNGMMMGRISALAEWANDDFGIDQGDHKGVRRVKLMCRFLMNRSESVD
jgi:hypothetical protein